MARRESQRPSRPEKVCVYCGRSFAYRKKWERVWDQVKYCSDRCRRSAKTGEDLGPPKAEDFRQAKAEDFRQAKAEDFRQAKAEDFRQAKAEDFRQRILDLLQSRSAESSICPSEVLPVAVRKDKVLMERVRQMARLMAHQGIIEITQKGQVVNPDDFRGPIRLRRPR